MYYYILFIIIISKKIVFNFYNQILIFIKIEIEKNFISSKLNILKMDLIFINT